MTANSKTPASVGFTVANGLAYSLHENRQGKEDHENGRIQCSGPHLQEAVVQPDSSLDEQMPHHHHQRKQGNFGVTL